MLKDVNLKDKLLKERNQKVKDTTIDIWVQSIFDALDVERENILQKLSDSEGEQTNNFVIDKIEKDKVFHLDQIRNICIDYRLRFLDTKYFKGDFTVNAISKIRQLEEEHGTKIDGFKIIAPSKLIVLKKEDDPLLIFTIGNDY